MRFARRRPSASRGKIDATSPTAKHVPKENRRTLVHGHAAAALRLLILTGARLREILGLRRDHVDIERGLLLLPDSKSGRKTIVLNAPAVAILAALPHTGLYVIAGDNPDVQRHDLNRPWRMAFDCTICVTLMQASGPASVWVCRSSASCSDIRSPRRPHGTHILTPIRCVLLPTGSAGVSPR